MVEPTELILFLISFKLAIEIGLAVNDVARHLQFVIPSYSVMINLLLLRSKHQ